jgi:hypothetical protein
MSTISASTATNTAYKVTADTTGTLVLQTGSTPTTAVTIDTSQNVGIGTSSPGYKLDVKGASGDILRIQDGTNADLLLGTNSTSPYIFVPTSAALRFGTANTERARIDSSGNLLVGTTSQPTGTYRLVSSTNGTGASGGALFVSNQSNAANESFSSWHTATSGNNTFCYFGTEATFTSRGSITYNRGAGLVAYNVTSDYRAKDIIGPVENSGALIDSVPVYMGKMKGATQERPMFIAHEVPAYAHTGEKDAVDDDGNPVYQQMDTSALVPVMWAEIQSLRQRLAALENK